MNVNRYRMRQGVTVDTIKAELKRRGLPSSSGGLYINAKSVFCFWKSLVEDIEVAIAIPENLSEWDDENYVLVMDDSFGQPYTPFYMDGSFLFLEKVKLEYNRFMNSLNFLERVEVAPWEK